jgi:hypothetical protein
MTGAPAGGAADAAAMPSWSTSEDAANGTTTPPEEQTASELESARRLLEQLFAGPEPNEQPAQPEQ